MALNCSHSSKIKCLGYSAALQLISPTEVGENHLRAPETLPLLVVETLFLWLTHEQMDACGGLIRLRWAYPLCVYGKSGDSGNVSLHSKENRQKCCWLWHEATLTRVSEWGILGHYIPAPASCKPLWAFFVTVGVTTQHQKHHIP